MTKNAPPSNPLKAKVTSASAAKAISAAAKLESKKTQYDKSRYRFLEPDDFHAVERSLNIPRLTSERKKLLRPGIWTVLAVIGTYSVFAYIDANYGEATSPVALQPGRPETSDSWFLTPTVIRDGIKAAWQDLDKLTIGIIGFSAVVHVLRRVGLLSLVNLVHVTSYHRYTAFTYPFINKNWPQLGLTSLVLCWILPGVVRHFDGDLWHTAAFLEGVSLTTAYLQHVVLGFTFPTRILVNRGAAYMCQAIFGAYCVAYSNEKMWTPAGIVLRLDSANWGLLWFGAMLYWYMRAAGAVKILGLLYGPMQFGLGAAYVHFDGKNKVWNPLVGYFSTRDTTALFSGQ